MIPVSEVRRQSRTNMGQQYGICVGSVFLSALIGAGASWLIRFIPVWGTLKNVAVTLLLTGFLEIGLSQIYLAVVQGRQANMTRLFSPFSQYGRNLGAMAWRYLWTFLWGLLLIPAVIKNYEYMMVPYLLADCPSVTARKALRMSRIMTDGYKLSLFGMILSITLPFSLIFGVLLIIAAFIHLVVVWIVGILGAAYALLYLAPCLQAALSRMYLELRDEALRCQILAVEDFQ